MRNRQTATGAQSRASRPTAGISAAPKSDDLFATIYEQTQRVLGKTAGFYIVTCDNDRGLLRLDYHVDGGDRRAPGATFAIDACDALCERRPLINDSFSQVIGRGIANSICVPMIRNNVPLGAFGAYAAEERAYDGRDAKALLAIAEIGSLALENAQFLTEIQKARREAERLEEIGRAISGSLDLSQVLQRVVDAARELIHADSATVWLLRGDDEVEVAMTSGEIAPPRGLTMPVSPVMRERMVQKNKPYFVYEDLKSGDHELPLNMRNLTSARSTMAVALVAEDSVLGALSVGHREPVRYQPVDIRLLERLSYQAAIAVTNARLHEQIRALSLTDPLTEMPNRRHLDIFLEKEFAAAKRGRLLSVLLFDLDHFKAYNDRAGHPAGDAVLRAFGNVLLSQTRAMNLAARYGGDEFMTILADTDERGAQAHAERIMAAIEKDPTLAKANLRACVGIASFDPSMESFGDLVGAADKDLYARKATRLGDAAVG